MAGWGVAGRCMARRAVASCTESRFTFNFSGLQHDLTSFRYGTQKISSWRWQTSNQLVGTIE